MGKNGKSISLDTYTADTQGAHAQKVSYISGNDYMTSSATEGL